MRNMTIYMDNWENKETSKRVILKNGGEITSGYQCGKYFCLEYRATDEAIAKIDETLRNMGLLTD